MSRSTNLFKEAFKAAWAECCCKVGAHKWEQDPSQKEFLRKTGPNIVFWTACEQTATRKCTAAGCAAAQDVARSGFAGAGGFAGEWRPISAQEKARINALPRL